MTMLVRGTWIAIALAACGGSEDAGPPPLAEVPGTLQHLAVNDTSIFAIDTTDSSLVELGLDGALIGKVMTRDAVSEVVAYGDWVAWVEAEGNGKIIRRRRAGKFESMRPFAPHIAASAEGLFYSDNDLIASWPWEGVPERVVTPASGATLIGMDPSYAYTREMNKSLVRYTRMADMSETLLSDATGVSLKDGQLAYRTADGVRLRDLFTTFDRVVGAPPADYTSELLIAGRAVMCGKYRLMDGTTDELLADPVGGYAARGKDVYWVTTKPGGSPVTQLRLADAEAPLEME
jgi:hypothetical protein